MPVMAENHNNMQFIPNTFQTKYYHLIVNTMFLLYEICKNNFVPV